LAKFLLEIVWMLAVFDQVRIFAVEQILGFVDRQNFLDFGPAVVSLFINFGALAFLKQKFQLLFI
jgi:hypothetical protein